MYFDLLKHKKEHAQVEGIVLTVNNLRTRTDSKG